MSNNFCWGKINSYFFLLKNLWSLIFTPNFFPHFFWWGEIVNMFTCLQPEKFSIKEAESEKKHVTIPWNPEIPFSETPHFSPLKMDGLKTIVSFLLGFCYFQVLLLLVSGRVFHKSVLDITGFVQFFGEFRSLAARTFQTNHQIFVKTLVAFCRSCGDVSSAANKNPDRWFVGIFQRQNNRLRLGNLF